MWHIDGILQRARRLHRRAGGVIAAIALAAAPASGVAITLAWDPVVHPLLSGYAVYVGTAPGRYDFRYLNGGTTSYSIDGAEEGVTYYFAVTAYDVFYRESDFSNEVHATIPYRAPTLDFSASGTRGPAPLAINFASKVQGSVTSYQWTFGDGTSSTSPNPVHVYITPGVYDVGVTVAGPGGTATERKPAYVTVLAAPVPGSGLIAGSVAPAPAATDLTAAGALDWVQWPGGVRKGGVKPLIAGPTLVGLGAVAAIATSAQTLQWTDGAPLRAGSTSEAVSVGGTGRGFAVTVPADPTPRTLTLFVGARNAGGRLVARFSDGSAPEFAHRPVVKTGASWSGIYTIVYRAATAGQSMRVEWTQVRGAVAAGQASSAVIIQGAALATVR